ncbi:MAG TPA: CUAEP/CCAEP-tail radical SAM protein [Myxococcales bacterium]|nr:CUAEP/CCAEP-tail radical SAM protein [Myxococcales bacterium]
MILLVSCYELGRQPVGVAKALAALERAGFETAVQDVSVERLSLDLVRKAEMVFISVPMHTALQLGVRVAARVREQNPRALVAFFGLYAALNREHLLERHGDFVVGESDEALVALAAGQAPAGSQLPRTRDATVPSRAALPPLPKYAQLVVCGGEKRLVASVEASRGCKHLCRHCPIVPVYGGKFVAVPVDAVMADIEQQVRQGAQHVSFADPDFLNGPTHALRVARELSARWPELTYDATIKIEHLLQHRTILPELVKHGLLFVTSAVESLSDRVLVALGKGHTAADVPPALQAVRDAGAELRPTLLPYTPWTALDDLPRLFDFALEHELVEAIDPVQYSLRLLLPPGSLLLQGSPPWLREFDAQAFTYRWEHGDPRVDALWRASSQAVHAGAGFDELCAIVSRQPRRRTARRREVPRLTEPWFC